MSSVMAFHGVWARGEQSEEVSAYELDEFEHRPVVGGGALMPPPVARVGAEGRACSENGGVGGEGK
jgi:hypothetical protein